jgi:glycolate oxidase
VLAPFDDLDQVTAAVPKIISSELALNIVEYIDDVLMAALADREPGQSHCCG